MEETLNCPACGTAIQADSLFCKKCGREILRCPGCGTLVQQELDFCPKCGRDLGLEDVETEPSTGGAEEPYLVWEGWPFSWLGKTVQTRLQWRIYIVLISIALGLVVVYVVLLAVIFPSADVCCMSGLIIGLIGISVLALLIRYRVGREGAAEELKEGRKDG